MGCKTSLVVARLPWAQVSTLKSVREGERDGRESAEKLKGMLSFSAFCRSDIVEMCISGDNTKIASGSNDFTVRLWSLATGEPLHVCGCCEFTYRSFLSYFSEERF